MLEDDEVERPGSYKNGMVMIGKIKLNARRLGWKGVRQQGEGIKRRRASRSQTKRKEKKAKPLARWMDYVYRVKLDARFDDRSRKAGGMQMQCMRVWKVWHLKS